MKVIFWGAKEGAKILRECIRTTNLELVALFDDDTSLTPAFDAVPLYFGKKGFENWLSTQSSSEEIGFILAMGNNTGKIRVNLHNYLESKGLTPITAQHPTSYAAYDARIGKGSQLLGQSFVGVDAEIGKQCIINTGASIDHSNKLGDGVHICPGVRVAGCVIIGSYVMIGTGASVLPYLTIGEGAIIGAGAVVTKNVAPYDVVVGVPARSTNNYTSRYANSRTNMYTIT